jgi:superfamily II DNA or RNA helicase
MARFRRFLHNIVIMEKVSLQLSFDGGTVVLEGGDPGLLASLPGCRLDVRTHVFRAEARFYRGIVEEIRRRRISYEDRARNYHEKTWTFQSSREPFPHQTEALETWWKAGGRGVVVLPTGTGKTFLALLAIARANRPTFVVTPTIDLLNQWYVQLRDAFGNPIGLVGGGSYELQPITVTTYDSAYIYLERWGNRFGLVVFDECHHLPGETYIQAAIGSIAPFRLGLTATPERADGREYLLYEVVGPLVYRREIKQLAGDFLAEYRTQRVYVGLSAEEQEQYRLAREQYRRFLSEHGISMASPSGWQRFLRESCRGPDGRAAFLAYRMQKRLALAAPAKLHKLEELLQQHRYDRMLIFTYDNDTVYQIARRFLVPAITHQTNTKERQKILERFHDGEYSVVVTSQVLNEGVDVPSANVGIILSGTGSVREHVQRLGRLLRKQGDKQAILYELVTRDTAEEFTSERRRQHHAYQ